MAEKDRQYDTRLNMLTDPETAWFITGALVAIMLAVTLALFIDGP